MNQLSVSLQHSIATLTAKGWSARKIARELDIDRGTVRRYRLSPDSKPAIVPIGSKAGRTSQCAPFSAVIEGALLAGLSAQRIYQDLVADHGFTGGYDAVKRFVRRLARQTEPPFRRMECAPGQELQVDFGQGAWVIVNGKRRRPHLFRAVLSHSRKAYSEVVWRQTTESFLRSLENAFRHFGGVTATVVIDNLKAGVLQADWYDPHLNPKLEEFARHYGTVILPTKPAMPRHKGKVESGVKYARNNAIKGRTFQSLTAQNTHLADWEKNVADTRIHGTIRRQVGNVLCALDVLLLASPAEGFSLSVAEAWYCQVPVVATRVGAIPELERKYGQLVSPIPVDPTPGQLADAVKRALSPEFRNEVIPRAQEMVCRHYTADDMVQRWVKYLYSIVPARPNVRPKDQQGPAGDAGAPRVRVSAAASAGDVVARCEAMIKSFRRFGPLLRLVTSLRRFYPWMKVLIADDSF
jgi:transposase